MTGKQVDYYRDLGLVITYCALFILVTPYSIQFRPQSPEFCLYEPLRHPQIFTSHTLVPMRCIIYVFDVS